MGHDGEAGPVATLSSPEERTGTLKDIVSELGVVRIDRLTADFGVSEMTVRRDNPIVKERLIAPLDQTLLLS